MLAFRGKQSACLSSEADDSAMTDQTDTSQPRAAPEGPISILVCKNCGAKNRIRPSPRGVPTCAKCKQPLPWLVDASDASFDLEANASTAVVVDLWAPWCGPCRFVSPILEELSREYAGRLKVVKVNVDENPATAQRFEAYSIPTLVVLHGGRPVDRIVGALPKSQLAVRLSPWLLRRSTPADEASQDQRAS
jgi:thioredoxin 2